jgi:hypothetical protein
VRYLTVTIIRLGATQKYATGWEAAFGGKKRSGQKSAVAGSVKSAAPKKKAARCKKTTAKKAK